MKKISQVLISGFIFFVFITSVSLAQSFTSDQGLEQVSENPIVLAEDADCGEIELTHSTSQLPMIGDSVACTNADQSMFRAYELNSFDIFNNFQVCAVRFGISTANSNGTQPITIILYTSDPAFPDGNLTQLASTTIQIEPQTETLITVPINAIVPAGSELVVEIFDPFEPTSNFFIGANSQPETAPSYIQAAACGAPTPLTTAEVAFPNSHFIINAIGNELSPTDIPTLSEWGLIAMAGILGLVGFMVIRRRNITA